MIACRCGCGRIAHTRGLHPACYRRAKQLVKAGKTTWAKLEASGKAELRKAKPHWGHTGL